MVIISYPDADARPRRTPHLNQRVTAVYLFDGTDLVEFDWRTFPIPDEALVISSPAGCGPLVSDLNVTRPIRLTCARGHVLDESNTYWATNGYRQCVACRGVKPQRVVAEPVPVELTPTEIWNREVDARLARRSTPLAVHVTH